MMPRMPLARHARATLVLGLPLIGSSLAQMALQVVNTVMVGWYGVTELAALVLGSAMFFVIFVLGSGFARAVMPLAAHAHASGDEAQLRRPARMALWLSAAYGIAVYPLFWWSEAILLFLRQKPEVAALARDYMHLAGLGMIPTLWVAVLQSWLAALGRTQVVLWVTVAAVALNAALGWLAIFGNGGLPALGVAGAALATLGAQLASLAVLWLYAAYLPALRPLALFRRFWRPDAAALGSVLRLGLPIGLTGLAESGLFQGSAVMMGWIGTAPLAGHGIALQVTALAFMIHIGLSSAATIRVAAFLGRGDARGLREAAGVAWALSALVALGVIALLLAVPGWIVGLFVDPADPRADEIAAFGILLLRMAALFQLVDAMQAMALGLLRGIQDTRVPMWIAGFSYWVVGLPCAYLLAFPLGLGGVGLWFGLTAGLASAGLGLMARFWSLAPKPGVGGEAPL